MFVYIKYFFNIKCCLNDTELRNLPQTRSFLPYNLTETNMKPKIESLINFMFVLFKTL